MQSERVNDEVEEGELPYECGAVVVSTANSSVPILPGDRLLTINGVNVGQSPLRPVSFDSVVTVLRETFEAAWSLQPCVISVARPLVVAPSLAPVFVRCVVPLGLVCEGLGRVWLFPHRPHRPLFPHHHHHHHHHHHGTVSYARSTPLTIWGEGVRI